MVIIISYNPFLKTAIKRNELSRPMKILLKKNLLHGNILDMGTGYGLDLDFLRPQFRIVGYDKFNPDFKDESLLIDVYDTVTCNYVFNVIPDLDEHNELLKQLRLLSDNIHISVRSDKKAIQPNWRYEEKSLGYWTNRDSFQRFYTKDLVREMFGDVEFIHSDGALILFKLL